MATFAGTLLLGVANGSLYALIAIGAGLILSSSGVIDFARGPLVVLAALVTYSLQEQHRVGPALTVAAATAAIAVAGVVQERTAISPLRGDDRSAGWLVSTLGFGLIVQAAATIIFSDSSFAVTPIIGGGRRAGNVALHDATLLLIPVGLVVAATTWAILRHTTAGRCLRAVAEDPEAAALRGINVRAYRLGTFAVAGALAGLTGFLSAPLNAFAAIAPLYTIKGFVATVVGGAGSVWGAIAGGWLLGISEAMGGYLVSGKEDLFGLGVLVIVLLIRPEGIFASRRLRHA